MDSRTAPVEQGETDTRLGRACPSATAGSPPTKKPTASSRSSCRRPSTTLTFRSGKGVIWSYPDFPLSYRWLTAAFGQLGGYQRRGKRWRRRSWSRLPRLICSRVPWMRPQDHARMLEGLCKAEWEE